MGFINSNHRDAWVYGTVDPNSGTAAMLEAVHGIGALLKQGWQPKRTIVFCSWDAEEEGLIGSTEWVEQQAQNLDRAVAYFNTDVGVSGPDFSASAVPSLKRSNKRLQDPVPSPIGGTVYQEWRLTSSKANEHRASNAPPQSGEEVHVSDLGSGSDFTPFLQHAGVPSTDVGSSKAYAGLITPPSTTLPGSSRTPTRILSTCRKWRASLASKRFAWLTSTSCPTITKPTPAK